MSLQHKLINLSGITLPFIAFVAAVIVFWGSGIYLRDLLVMLALYLITCLGITIGFHRYLTHRSFKTSKALRYTLTVMGSLACEGDVTAWVADHRKHHSFSDEEGDPHSPHVGHGGGLKGTLAGLYHAHIGWILTSGQRGAEEKERYVPDLLAEPFMAWSARRYHLFVIASLLIPFLVGFILGGSVTDGLLCLLWGGLVRIFLLHHVTYSINSICHFFGSHRYATDDHSGNVAWLAPFSLGEAWHHNHHAFPTSALHGLGRVERWLDPSGLIIRALARLGLVWDVVRVNPEQERKKRLAAG